MDGDGSGGGEGLPFALLPVSLSLKSRVASSSELSAEGESFPWTFMCFRREEGCV